VLSARTRRIALEAGAAVAVAVDARPTLTVAHPVDVCVIPGITSTTQGTVVLWVPVATAPVTHM
jgi:hypothetical protein